MGLEVANFISELIITNPVGPSDFVDKGDDHLRLIKGVLQGTFPNASAAINPTPTEFNLLVGLTGTVWASSNDGAGSGLDADLLDAQEGAYYLAFANATGQISAAQHGILSDGTMHTIASDSVAGFLSSANKIKLDGIETAATADQTFAEINALGTYSGALIDVQIFTSSDTWTKPAGTLSVEVWAVGGGGGGGGSDVSTTGVHVGIGGGGGGGGLAYKHITSGIGATETITVGSGGAGGSALGLIGVAGGDSTFGSLITGDGGFGGPGSGTSTQAWQKTNGGNGGNGIAVGGIVFAGERGQSGLITKDVGVASLTVAWGSGGGGSGGGFAPGHNIIVDAGAEAGGGIGKAYGGGGSGSHTETDTGLAGGTGADGQVIVKSYG